MHKSVKKKLASRSVANTALYGKNRKNKLEKGQKEQITFQNSRPFIETTEKMVLCLDSKHQTADNAQTNHDFYNPRKFMNEIEEHMKSLRKITLDFPLFSFEFVCGSHKLLSSFKFKDEVAYKKPINVQADKSPNHSECDAQNGDFQRKKLKIHQDEGVFKNKSSRLESLIRQKVPPPHSLHSSVDVHPLENIDDVKLENI